MVSVRSLTMTFMPLIYSLSPKPGLDFAFQPKTMFVFWWLAYGITIAILVRTVMKRLPVHLLAIFSLGSLIITMPDDVYRIRMALDLYIKQMIKVFLRA